MSNNIHGNVGGNVQVGNKGSSIGANGGVTYNPTPNSQIGIQGNITHDMPKGGPSHTGGGVLVSGEIKW